MARLLLHLVPILALILPVLSQPPPDNPTITLPHAKLIGTNIPSLNLTLYRRIPFAAPPVGALRFRAPQPPLHVPIYNTNQPFPACRGAGNYPSDSEDCLYLAVYSKAWSQPQRLRPVAVFFYGGGFIRGGASLSIPPSAYPILNSSATNDIVFVYPNYRTNAFGFLPGSPIAKAKDADFNPGLLDQEAALRWVQEHIAAFGGDAADVTIWGQSAGGGSVIAQVVAQTGRGGQPLFRKALASSPFWPRTYAGDGPEADEIYVRLIQEVNCGGAKDTLACLRGVESGKLAIAAGKISGVKKYTTSTFLWAPVVDGVFLKTGLSEAVKKGLDVEMGFGMYNAHEGENFTPGSLKKGDFEQWLRGFLPGFDARRLTHLEQLYPPNGDAGSFSYADPWERAGSMYRDLVLACPALWLGRGARKGGYVGEYAISPAKHASDVGFWNTVNPLQRNNETIYHGFAGAFASFFQSGEAHAGELKLPDAKSGMELVIESKGFRTANIALLEERCAFWLDNAKNVPF
ncbi:carboxylesteras-like protein [Trichodelitschia bisporula]|uniref:Carboxylic ester hydrolase n=1 Tax=Trichodelitschia bisporula TaxID=703511 RepID=A0A6G1HYL8_9PEZI|nr:carboxylesteras-like protein [Trichodelitschia bisporula]